MDKSYLKCSRMKFSKIQHAKNNLPVTVTKILPIPPPWKTIAVEDL